MNEPTIELNDLVAEADDAFWQVIVRHFPQASSGDLSPLLTVRLHLAQREAVAGWIYANVPQPDWKATKGIDHD